MRKKSLLFLIILFLASNATFGQLDNYRKKLKEFRYSKYLDSAVFYFEKGLPIALKNKDSIAIFMLYKNLGDAYEHHQQLEKTLTLYAICDRYIPKKNFKLQSFLLSDKAYTYNLLHDYDQSAKLTLQSLVIAENSKDQKEIATASISVAEGFSNLNLNVQADEYFKKGIAIATNLRSSTLVEYAHRYYAVHLLKTKRTDLGLQNLMVSTALATKLRDTISMAYNYQQLSIYYWQKQQILQCFEFGKKAENIWEQRAENRDLASVCAQMGKYHLKLRQYKDAEFYLKKSEKYLFDDLYFNQDLYSDLSSLYQKTNKNDLAFNYLLLAKTIIEKIKETENKSKVASLRIKFEADQKELQLRKQNQLFLAKETASNLRFWILMVFLLFLIVVIIIVAFYLKKIQSKNQQLNKANVDLEKMSLQKKILLQEIHHRVKNNLTTLKSLFYLQSKSSENIDLKNVLKECELRIDSMAIVHQSLYENGESDDVDFQSFIDNLFQSLENTYKQKDCKIDVKVQLNNVTFKLSKSIYLGLVLNELATNSYKYAFQNQKEGSIELFINKMDSNIEILYYDSGTGIKDFDQKKQGFGLKLIDIMMQQLNSKIEYSYQNGLSQFRFLVNEI